MKNKRVIVTLQGGLVQEVNIPKGLQIEVHILDFDIFEDPQDSHKCNCKKNQGEHSHLIYGPKGWKLK